jgi:hypothetical protein
MKGTGGRNARERKLIDHLNMSQSPNIWKRNWQIQILFMIKLRAGYIISFLATIKLSIFFCLYRLPSKNTELHGLSPASELYRPSNRRLSAKWLPTFADRGCHVVSVTDPYGRILAFLDRNRYFFYQVAPQLYSRGRMDPVPDPLLFCSGSAGNRTRASGSVAKNSDH